MSAAPGGKWKHVSAQTARSWGFAIDKSTYPWRAYKGSFSSPLEWHWIPTDEEAKACKQRREKSRQQALKINREIKQVPINNNHLSKEVLLLSAQKAISIADLKVVIELLISQMPDD